jgi:rubrerythrin
MMPIETTVNEIEYIKEMLPLLSETTLHELRTFMDYLADRERRHKALVKRVLEAEKNPDTIVCSTAEEFIQAIESAKDDG